MIEVKAAIRKRDGNRCVRCGMTRQQSRAKYGRDLDVHRTTPGSEYSTKRGVCETLCKGCHSREPRKFLAHGMADFARSIGTAIRSVREASGVTQAQLAAAIGKRIPHISRLEAGTHLPSVATLKKVADTLKVPICSLLDAPAKRVR